VNEQEAGRHIYSVYVQAIVVGGGLVVLSSSAGFGDKVALKSEQISDYCIGLA